MWDVTEHFVDGESSQLWIYFDRLNYLLPFHKHFLLSDNTTSGISEPIICVKKKGEAIHREAGSWFVGFERGKVSIEVIFSDRWYTWKSPKEKKSCKNSSLKYFETS